MYISRISMYISLLLVCIHSTSVYICVHTRVVLVYKDIYMYKKVPFSRPCHNIKTNSIQVEPGKPSKDYWILSWKP